LAVNEPTAFDAAARFDLVGRRVLVTGAGHGLGLAIATGFAGAGGSVALIDVDAAAVDEAVAHIGVGASQVTVHGEAVDVRDDDGVRAAVDRSIAALAGLDILVNGAAIYPVGPIETMPSSTVRDVLDVNVAGYARMVQAATPALISSGRGRVVNLASITFYLGFPDGLGAYIASKGAVIGLTRALARELGPRGVTVNVVAPGAFPTRAEEIIEDRAAYDVQILSSQAVKRRGDVGDIAAAVMFLASDAASFITGQTLVVDGGWVFD
jgi:NAD(P)-dependent dehydrogenase (short-subunit alcohol dehydrogenase family)